MRIRWVPALEVTHGEARVVVFELRFALVKAADGDKTLNDQLNIGLLLQEERLD